MRSSWGLTDILLLAAIICFVLAAVGISLAINLVALGLALGFASFLVGNRGLRAP